jgi:cytochrome c oxidase subunit II
LADTNPDLLQRPLPDGVVPAEMVARAEKLWLSVMVGMLALMMAVVVLTGVTHAIHPPSNVETIDPATLHLGGELAESNLGTAQERDGSLTVRLVAGQYGFAPDCTKVAVDTAVKFRLTSADVVHGLLLPSTNSIRWSCRALSRKSAPGSAGPASTACRATNFAAPAIMACGPA